MSSLIGTTLGQYEIVDNIGQGGMATVYLGRQPSMDRLVAVKVLPPHPGLDEQFRRRFELEARTIGNLQHPNILPVYDYGADRGILYIVSAYIEGGTLQDLIEQGPMDVEEVGRLLQGVCSGLAYAHRQQVIHRDIKPSNILMSQNNPLLADFGMVKMAAAESNLTGTAIVGTPAYMSPEQGQGLEVDGRSDIYALGCVLYEMLSGQQPYKAETPMQVILKHIQGPVPDIDDVRPDLPEAIQLVVRTALAKSADERYPTADALLQAYEAALRGEQMPLLQAAKRPTQDKTAENHPTIRLPKSTPQPTPGVNTGGETDNSTPSPTIIQSSSTNPLVLLSAFGLIALTIVVVAILLINATDDGPAIAGPQPTEQPIVVERGTALPPTAETTNTQPAILQPTDNEPTFGRISFSTDDELGDTVTVRIEGVRTPGDNEQYAAWLLNSLSGNTLLVGTIVVDGFGDGSVVLTTEDGSLLPAQFNALLLTLEGEDIGEQPGERIPYYAFLPTVVMDSLAEIFVSSVDGIRQSDGTNSSLYRGAFIEAGFAELHAGLASGSNTIGGVRTHAEHTINILLGESVDYNNDGRAENPGRGVGIYFFLDQIDSQLSMALQSANAGEELQINAEFMRVCARNVRTWSDEVVRLEREMIAGETVEAVQEQATRSLALTEALTNGIDANLNGSVEAFEGECGLDQIPQFGLQFAQMSLLNGPPPEGVYPTGESTATTTEEATTSTEE